MSHFLPYHVIRFPEHLNPDVGKQNLDASHKVFFEVDIPVVQVDIPFPPNAVPAPVLQRRCPARPQKV